MIQLVKSVLSKKEYVNDPLYPCVFIKKMLSGCVIIICSVDVLKIIWTKEEIHEVISYFKRKFEIKDFGKIKYYIGLQIEYMQSVIPLH